MPLCLCGKKTTLFVLDRNETKHNHQEKTPCTLVPLYLCGKNPHNLNIKLNLNGTAIVVEDDVVGKLLHEEDAPATQFEDVFGSGGVGQVGIVEPAAFVGDEEGHLVFQPFDAYANVFRYIPVVAVIDGVGHGFGKADQDVAIHIGAELVLLEHQFYERLYPRYVFRVGG